MTVGELIDVLRDYDMDAPVRFAYPARDYVRSTLGRMVTEVGAGFVSLERSQHDDPTVIDEDDAVEAEEDDPESVEECVILA